MSDYEKMVEIYEKSGGKPEDLEKSDTAHLVVERNRVLGSHLVPGLKLDVKETDNGISAFMVVKEGVNIPKPVHLCFGVLAEEGLQKIDMDVKIENGAGINVFAHCVFPSAVKVKHLMDAKIELADNATFSYNETHFHGTTGGVEVIPKAKVSLGDYSAFKSVFNLQKGRVGLIDFGYDMEVGNNSTLEIVAKVNGCGDDIVKISEKGYLKGEKSKGLLETRIALRDNAKGEVYSELIADASGAKGHVDCTEIIRDNASAKAVPVVDVRHPEAQVTHEAAIGSVNRTQLETLMARGLTEDEAAEMIIQGMLQG